MHSSEQPTKIGGETKLRVVPKKKKSDKLLWIAMGSLSAACVSVAGLIIFATANEPGIKDPTTQREEVEAISQATYERNARIVNKRLQQADFSPNYLGENVEPGLIQQSLAMHARFRRAQIQKEISNPNSPWHGKPYDVVAYSAIRNNLDQLDEAVYKKENVVVETQGIGGEKVRKSSSSYAGIAFLLFDTQAIIMTQTQQTDHNFRLGESTDNLDKLIYDFQNSRANFLAIRGLTEPADQIRVIDTVEKEVEEKARIMREKGGSK